MTNQSFTANTRQSFATEAEAFAWLYERVDDPCIDNERFAFEDDVEAVSKYDAQADSGCCGRADYEIIVAGRNAIIGCNYGH